MRLRVPSILLFLAMAVVQASLGDMISIHGVKPSFVLVVVYALSITGGEWKGLVYGSMGGLVEDCLSGGYMGLFLSAYALVGYAAGKAGKKLVNVGESANFAGIFVLTLAAGIYVSAMLSTFVGGQDFFWRVLRFALPQALYNAVMGAVILWLFKEQVARRVPWLKAIKQFQVRF